MVFNASLYLKNSEWFAPGRGNAEGKGVIFKIKVSKDEITKRFLAYLGFRSKKLANYLFTTNIQKVRSFDEAKVCG